MQHARRYARVRRTLPYQGGHSIHTWASDVLSPAGSTRILKAFAPGIVDPFGIDIRRIFPLLYANFVLERQDYLLNISALYLA